MNRYKAATLHFIICAGIGGASLALFWFIWYPSPLLLAIGGHEIFLLVVGIDVVLGPLLTLVVFKSGKRSLKFDMGVIAALQVSAMAFGLNTLLEARPAYIAAIGGSFQVLQATEITDDSLRKANVSIPWWGPKLVGTKAAVDQDVASALEAVKTVGGDKGNFPQLHTPYESMSLQVIAQAKPIAELKQLNPTRPTEIDDWLNSRGFDDTTAKFQPIKISGSSFTIFLDAKTGHPIGIALFKSSS